MTIEPCCLAVVNKIQATLQMTGQAVTKKWFAKKFRLVFVP